MIMANSWWTEKKQIRKITEVRKLKEHRSFNETYCKNMLTNTQRSLIMCKVLVYWKH